MRDTTIPRAGTPGALHNGFCAKVAALAVAACFGGSLAQANPTNPVVTHGVASFTQGGNLLQITNTPNTIINWGSFSIGANEITRFIQQSSASAVLNRVGAGRDPSSILGALQSNGRVFLINPNGITFGAGSQINVAGLVASALNMSDADFLAGRVRFTDGLGNSVINNGNITTGSGGNVYLVGSAVTNNGIITSPKGEVILAAGNSVELVNPGTPDLRVEITAPDNQAVNLGQIISNSGRVGIYAGLINHAGTINANSVDVDAAGNITLKASKNIDLAAGSIISANGPQGGTVTVQSGDTTLAAGAIEAKGSAGQGGNVSVLGNLVGLTDNASINASGETGGGTVLVGGDYQGKNTAIQNAFRTYVGPDTLIKADAITSGNGGKVIVWSDDATWAYGSISARAGALSGNGGLIETSGHYLDVNGIRVSANAPNGTHGTWLLDPGDITVQATGANTNITTTNLGGTTIRDSNADNAILLTGSIEAALDGGTNVVVRTVTGTQPGDIFINDPITTTSGIAVALQFVAARNINVNANITATGLGPLALTFDAVGATNIGNVNINTNGGSITATANGATVNFLGTSTLAAANFNVGTINANTGSNTTFNTLASATNFNMTGATLTLGGFDLNVSNNASMSGASLINAGVNNVNFTATGGATFDWSGGTISGTGLLSTSGGVTSNITGATNLGMNWDMNGPGNISGGGSLGIAAGRTLTIDNNNSLTITNTSTVASPITGTGTLEVGTAISFTGALVEQSSLADVSISTVTLNNNATGTVSNLSGALRLGPGTDSAGSTYATGAGGFMVAANGTRTNIGNFTGSGFIQTDGGNWTLNNSIIPAAMRLAVNTGTMTVNGGPYTLALIEVHAGGTLTGNANLSTASFLWDGGTVAGTGTWTTSAATVSGPTTLQRNWTMNGVMDLSGSIAIAAGTTLSMGVGSTLNITTPSGVAVSGGGTLTLQQATVNKNGAGTVSIAPAVFNTTFATTNTVVNTNGGILQIGGGTDTNTLYQGAGGLEFLTGTRAMNGTTQIATTGGPVNFSGANVTFANTTTYNPTGTTTISGGTVNMANLNVVAGNSVTVAGGALNASGVTTIDGLLATAGGAFNATGAVNVGGTLRGSVSGPINAAGQVISVPGTLDLNGGSVTAGNVNVSGTLRGIGSITGNVNNSGTVAPGASPGILSITGNYTQTAAGTLQIEIGGTAPGTGYDQLQVSGNANLDGTMVITQFGTFVPAALNAFRPITTGGAVTGTFANVVIPTAFAGLGVSYFPNSVDVNAPAAPLTIVAVDPKILNEDKDIFEQVADDQDIFRKLGMLVCD